MCFQHKAQAGKAEYRNNVCFLQTHKEQQINCVGTVTDYVLNLALHIVTNQLSRVEKEWALM